MNSLLRLSKLGKTITFLVLAYSTCIPATIYGFMPEPVFVNIVGVGGSASHRSITEAAILGDQISNGVLKDKLGVQMKTPGMLKAVREITFANTALDISDIVHGSSPENHFDSESFDPSRNNIISKTEKISMLLIRNVAGEIDLKTLWLNRDQVITEARKLLGEILHTIQDFYSHSSWVDGPFRQIDPTPHQALNWPFNVEFSDIYPAESTCTSGGYRDDFRILTTGWYSEEPPGIMTSELHKCIHGGPGDSLSKPPYVTFSSINKDTNSDILSPGGYLRHYDAAEVARQATVDFIVSIGEMLKAENPPEGAEKFRLLLGVDGVLLTNDGASNAFYSVKFNGVDLPVNCNSITCEYCHPSFCNTLITLDRGVSTILPYPGAEAFREQELYVRGELATTRQTFTISLPPDLVFVSGQQNTNIGIIPIDNLAEDRHSDFFIQISGNIHKSNTYKIRKK